MVGIPGWNLREMLRSFALTGVVAVLLLSGCKDEKEPADNTAAPGGSDILQRLTETTERMAPWELPDDQTIAVVDEIQITLGELREWGSVLRTRQGLDSSSSEGEGWFKKTAGNLMKSLVIYHALKLRAEENTPVPSDEDVDAEMGKIQSRFPDADAFEAYIERLGYSVADFRETIRQDMQFNRYLAAQAEKFSGPLPSDDVVNRYYQENRKNLVLPQAVKFRDIFLLPETVRPREEGQTTADLTQELYSELKNGADFGELAKKYTDRQSGYPDSPPVYMIQKELRDQELAARIFAAKSPGLMPPISTKAGYYIVEILEIRPPSYLPLDDTSREMLRRRIQDEQKRRALANWIEEQVLKHRIIIMNKVINDPDAESEDSTTPTNN